MKFPEITEAYIILVAITIITVVAVGTRSTPEVWKNVLYVIGLLVAAGNFGITDILKKQVGLTKVDKTE